MPRYKCPKCSTIVDAANPQAIKCPQCGYTSAAAKAPAAERAPMPMTAMGSAGAGQMGKPRKTGVVILLSIVTLGIYAIVYYFLVFHELNKRNGKDTEVLWFILGIVTGILLIVYFYKEMKKMQAYRTASGLAPGPGPVNMLWWLLPLLGGFILMAKVNGSAREYWIRQGAK